MFGAVCYFFFDLILIFFSGNHYGQLGLEERSIGKSHSTPRVLTLNFIIKEISCGEDHAALVTSKIPY